MRIVDTKEIVHGLYISGRDFRDVTDAAEYLATHFFNDDEDFDDLQVAIALNTVRDLRLPVEKAPYSGGFYDFDNMVYDPVKEV